jgi:hypothetical protein
VILFRLSLFRAKGQKSDVLIIIGVIKSREEAREAAERADRREMRKMMMMMMMMNMQNNRGGGNNVFR